MSRDPETAEAPDARPLGATPLIGEPHTLAELFAARARATPDADAYRQWDPQSERWQTWSWARMGREVARWRSALAGEGFEPGDRVALMLRNCREWAAFDLAAQSLGLVTVPLYTNDRAENIGYILQDAGARLLLVEGPAEWQELSAIHDQLAGLRRVVSLEPIEPNPRVPRVTRIADWLPEEADSLSALALDADTLATIVYTSGTTGRPKGVMLSHDNILSNIQGGLRMIEVRPDDLFLSFLPLSHALERTVGHFLPIATGSCIAYARSIAQLGEDLLTIRPTILLAVPRIFERVYAKIQAKLEQDPAPIRKLFHRAVAVGWHRFQFEQKREPWSTELLLWPMLERLIANKVQAKLGGRLRIAVSGGAPLSAEIARTFVGLGVPIVQGYGLTETSPIISANTLEDNIPDSIGLPLPGVEVRIGDGEEILTRGRSVMLGYWNNPEATRATIDGDGWLHTGDRGRIAHGHLYITGRLKEIIVLANGEKVAPADMEMAIALDPLIEQVMVIGEGRPFLTALVVLDPDHGQGLLRSLELGSDREALESPELEQALVARIEELTRSFPGYARVRRVAVAAEPWSIENGLLTPTMKLRRERVVDSLSDEIARLYSGH